MCIFSDIMSGNFIYRRAGLIHTQLRKSSQPLYLRRSRAIKRTIGRIYRRRSAKIRFVASRQKRKCLAARVKHVLDNDVSGIIVGFAVASMREQFRATLIVDSRRTRGHYLSPSYLVIPANQ